MTVALSAILILSVLSGCAGSSPVGAPANRAERLYYSPEAPEGETVVGIVSRQIPDLNDFLKWSDPPVLVLLSTELTSLDREATLLLETLAYEYRDWLSCIRVDADHHPEFAQYCEIGHVPGYAILEGETVLSSTGSLDRIDQGEIRDWVEGFRNHD